MIPLLAPSFQHRPWQSSMPGPWWDVAQIRRVGTPFHLDFVLSDFENPERMNGQESMGGPDLARLYHGGGG